MVIDLFTLRRFRLSSFTDKIFSGTDYEYHKTELLTLLENFDSPPIFFCRIRVAYYISFVFCCGVFWYGLGSSGVDIKKKEKRTYNDLQNNIQKTTDWAI